MAWLTVLLEHGNLIGKEPLNLYREVAHSRIGVGLGSDQKWNRSAWTTSSQTTDNGHTNRLVVASGPFC
jgi:hypothetical protein